jgi:phosphate transport system substrate-binding protein
MDTMKNHALFRLMALLALTGGGAVAGPTSVDPELPAYRAQHGMRGELHSVGADVMDVVTLGWLELFRAAHPRVVASLEARAPGTVVPALVNGWGQIGPIARELFPHEVQQFVEKFSYPPTRIRVATASYDHIGTAQTIAFYVADDNPLAALTLDQVREIYSKGGGITKWSQLGLTGDWADRPIELWGVRRLNGVANYIQERCLGGREFRAGINERFTQDDVHALDAITTGIAGARYALGYSGLSSARSGVKAIALAEHNGEPPVAPTLENVADHSYALARFVYIYVNRAPGKPLDPNVREFLRLVLSREGQEVVARQGLYVPLTAAIAREELAKLE